MSSRGQSIPFFTSDPIWTRRIANELWSGPVTPLTYALLAEPMAEHMVRRPLLVAGLADLAALPLLHRHASHVFVNAGLLAEVIRLLPEGLRSAGLLDLLPPAARTRVGAGASWVASGARALEIALRSWWGQPDWAPWRRAAAFDREAAAVRRELEKEGTFDAKPTAGDLLAGLVRVRERLGRYLDVVSWGVVFAYVFYHLVHELVGRWAPGLDAERAALTVGLPDVESLTAHHDLRALGPLIATTPGVAAALAAGGPAAAAEAIVRDPGAAGRAFDAFLARHGHRLTGRDLGCPTWRESPAMVIELAAPSPGSTATPASLTPAAAAERRVAAVARIDEVIGRGLAGGARRAAFHAVLGLAQRYYALRENMRYHADFFLARMRSLALRLGAELVSAGRLERVEDVLWLDLEELHHAIAGEGPFAARVAERRAAAVHDAANPPPETLEAAPRSAAPSAETAGMLRGEAGAPGHCRGPARLVHGAADFERVHSGDVLVAVYTDPGWTPVLERAAGLVLEAGGLLSHGAIVARELGIPALVGVAGAMRSIADGALVEIDAAAGVVTLVGGH